MGAPVRLNPEDLKLVELCFLCFKIRGRQGRIHNLTIIIGLLVCLFAGAVTVTQSTFNTTNNPLVRILRPARAGRRSGRESEFTPCIN